MRARKIIEDWHDQGTVGAPRAMTQPELPVQQQPEPRPQRPERSGPETWIVGSMHGMTPEEAGHDGIVAVVEFPAQTGILSNPRFAKTRRIGVSGAGSEGDYGPIGTQVLIKVDNMQGAYRFLNDRVPGTLVAYSKPSTQELRKHRVRSLYHFD